MHAQLKSTHIHKMRKEVHLGLLVYDAAIMLLWCECRRPLLIAELTCELLT